MLVAQVRRHGQLQNAAAQVRFQLTERLMVEVFHHELRTAALAEGKNAGAVGVIDVLLCRTLHSIERQKGIGDRLHVVQRAGEQHIVRIHQSRHHLKVAHALTVVVEGQQGNGVQQIFLRCAERHAGSVPHKRDEPFGRVQHAARFALTARKQPHGSEQGGARVAGANGKAVAGVAAADPHAAALRPHECKACAANTQVAPEVKVEVRQVEISAQRRVSLARRSLAVGEGRGDAEKVSRVYLRDVAWERRAQQIIGTAPHGFALVHRLLATVVVVEPLPIRAHRPQKLSHRRAQHFRVRNAGTDDVLFQRKSPPSLKSILQV